MGKLIDLTGKKFGRLTVIKRSYPNSKNRELKWLCKCDCGNERIVHGGALRNGNTISCGCFNKEKGRLKYGLSNMRKLIREYKRGARERGLKYELNDKQFKEITQKDCFYCGIEPKQRTKNRRANGDYIYNGIDRIDNTKGYVMDNVVPCCNLCNRAKYNLTLPEFKDWIKGIYNNIFIKGGNK